MRGAGQRVSRPSEQRRKLVAGRLEPFHVRRIAISSNQPVGPGGEEISDLDHVALHSSRHADDLPDPPMTVPVGGRMHHDVDAGSNRRHDERVADVLAREKRQRAQLCDRLTRRVGVNGAHPR